MEKEEIMEEELLQPEISNKENILQLEFSPQILLVQQQLNQIKINSSPLDENGLYNKETKDAIMKLQEITNFTLNGMIDQNLMFRLNEIIENPVINEINQNCTFAVLYSKYKENN